MKNPFKNQGYFAGLLSTAVIVVGGGNFYMSIWIQTSPNSKKLI